MNKCIFYLPYKLDKLAAGARMLRPRKMMQAFRDIGYKVYVIEGVSSERRKKIKKIKARIRSGERYDFMYTESHTEPTLLTDPHHMPTHPFLDFGFFEFVRKQGIPIGLFYCDIYWKFAAYGSDLPAWKRKAALLSYRYDIMQYKRLLSAFFVPDKKMCNYLEEKTLTDISSELPPGADDIRVERINAKAHFSEKEPLCLFYVGGLGSHYQILEFVKAVVSVKECELVICCREPEWKKEEPTFKPYLCDRIKVVHKASDELKPFYEKADICSLMFMRDEYIDMAKPFKAYEYLAYEIPVLSTKGTAIGDFVESNDIGWSIPFEADQIAEILRYVIANPVVLEKKRKNCINTKRENLWKSRTRQVADVLTQ